MKTFVPIFCIAVTAAYLACKETPSGPDSFKDPRTYTWTIDTLEYPGSLQTAMFDVWGGSPTDVYAVGWTGMYHYDGKAWKHVPLPTGDLSAIYGFATNDIWTAGTWWGYSPSTGYQDSSIILHYEGARWVQAQIPPGRSLLDVWGISPTDVWAGGMEGTLYHFDGVTWMQVAYPNNFSINSICGFSSKDIYALAYLYVQPVNSYSVFDHFDGTSWTRLDSTYPGQKRFGEADVWALAPNRLFSVGDGVFERKGNRWENVLSTSQVIRRIRGTGPNNMFAVGRGMVYHYNGIDWFLYTQSSDASILYSGVWTDGREVFVVGYTSGGYKTVVLHGK